ncbi:hypothetical protein J6590_083530 [Homalodisca vitripennis]|nr:hypothetical protein J6590_083530 [Homalodisca vitripennis]
MQALTLMGHRPETFEINEKKLVCSKESELAEIWSYHKYFLEARRSSCLEIDTSKSPGTTTGLAGSAARERELQKIWDSQTYLEPERHRDSRYGGFQDL